MKKTMKEITDGVTPEELQTFARELEKEDLPEGVSADRIAEQALIRAGLSPAGEEKPAAKKKKILPLRARLLAAAAAVLCMAVAAVGILPSMLRRSDAMQTEGVSGRTVKGEADGSGKIYRPGYDGEAGEYRLSFSGAYYGENESLVEEAADAEDGSMYSEIVPPQEVPMAPEPIMSADMAQAKAGLLTVKAYRDLDYTAEWAECFTEESWQALAGQWGFMPTEIVRVHVQNADGPVFNTQVELQSLLRTEYTARTDVAGDAYLVLPDKKGSYRVKVGGTEYKIPENRQLTVSTESAGIPVTALDLMLTVDTTGSMGDELRYLKLELEDTVRRVAAAGQNLSIRVSVNFYRDEGDAYVLRSNEFTSDLNLVMQQLVPQSAEGGGDVPEAVHTALEDAVSHHSWRDEAVKLCFLVLDAPPHSESQVKGVNASLRKSVMNASGQGIRILPVVSSGADLTTEYLMRSFAVMTNGRYLYLTDDSGIGYAHRDAEISQNYVPPTERLNDCMVRLICEYCGLDK